MRWNRRFLNVRRLFIAPDNCKYGASARARMIRENSVVNIRCNKYASQRIADNCCRRFAQLECPHDETSHDCFVTDANSSRRLLAPRKEPADHRKNTDDHAVAGYLELKRWRKESRGQVDRGGPHLSEALRRAATSRSTLLISGARTTRQALRFEARNTKPVDALSFVPGTNRHHPRQQA